MEEKILVGLEYVAIVATILGGVMVYWLGPFRSADTGEVTARVLTGIGWAIIPWCIVSIEHHRVMRKRDRDR